MHNRIPSPGGRSVPSVTGRAKALLNGGPLPSGRPHRLGQRLAAALELGCHPGRQVRVGPHLADELADHIRRGDVAGLGVAAQERVQLGRQVDGDPGRPPRRAACAGSSRTCGTASSSVSACSTGGTEPWSAGAIAPRALRMPPRRCARRPGRAHDFSSASSSSYAPSSAGAVPKLTAYGHSASGISVSITG